MATKDHMAGRPSGGERREKKNMPKFEKVCLAERTERDEVPGMSTEGLTVAKAILS